MDASNPLSDVELMLLILGLVEVLLSAASL